MKQKFTIKKIINKDKDSNQYWVTLSASNGVLFDSLIETSSCLAGDQISVSYFYWNAPEYFDWKKVFTQNTNQTSSIEQLNDSDYLISGQITDFEHNDNIAWVDAGGVFIPIELNTSDDQVVGKWLSFPVEQLNAEIDER